MSSKKRDRRIARELRIRHRATEAAFGEAVKDNLAETVIDNFVVSVAELPFEARFKFALGILRGNDDSAESLPPIVEDLARVLHEGAATMGATPWERLQEAAKELRRNQARGMFKAAGIEV